jgi:hypothetical protein
MLGGDVTRMDITVDTLEPATDANESFFASQARNRYLLRQMKMGDSLSQAQSTLQSLPFRDGMGRSHATSISTNTATCAASMDDAVIKPIREALMNWEYAPATINGHPSLG